MKHPLVACQVCHRRILAFLLTHIGSFKIDLSTVYKQPGTVSTRTVLRLPQYPSTDAQISPMISVISDHRFYQKWAPLTDPADTRSGVKGYVKMSINVLMKGDSLSPPSLPPTSTSGAQDHIEK